MASPEGYRKANRLMVLAERFRLPVVFLVDTPGAAAGVGAEERGQAQAIAECIETSLRIDVPVLSVVIGEGGSGGAVAFATANFIAMLEHSVYSVISPEGCASILWRTSEKKQEAALAQKLTAQNLKNFGVIDEIIPEPIGGAHRWRSETIDRVSDCLFAQLKGMQGQTHFAEKRRKKFLAMGRTLLNPKV
jgi:acetyl-CoA carboxylase carboxyl transferase subunit alpha